jgi:hypothetical protein
MPNSLPKTVVEGVYFDKWKFSFEKLFLKPLMQSTCGVPFSQIAA